MAQRGLRNAFCCLIDTIKKGDPKALFLVFVPRCGSHNVGVSRWS